LSRTSKCRRNAGDSVNPSSRTAPAPLSDERLLLQLRSLCDQRLDPRYRRKLEAITLFLQRRERHEIEDRAEASLRTVQRWTDSVRRMGPEPLRRRRRADRTSKLSADQRERLVADLKRRPASFGYPDRSWSASLLMRHVRQSYGVRFSLRHCRRLLGVLGAAKSRAVRTSTHKRRDSETGAVTRPPSFVPQPPGDYERKRRALARIKRLASSGLSLRPFAYTLFDLVHDGVPYDEVSQALAAASTNGSGWVVRNFDYDSWSPTMEKHLSEAGPEMSCTYPLHLGRIRRTVLRHEQIARPDYHRSEAYNEFFRPLGMHHGLLTLLRDEQGRFVGYFPVFRSVMMKPFSNDDIAFFEAAAAHIGYGISIAGSISSEQTDGSTFEPFQQVPQGVVVMDRAGKVLSLNRAAYSLFFNFAHYNDLDIKAFTSGKLSAALTYIAHQLRTIFGNYDDASAEASVPLVRMYAHRTGAVLRLRGFASSLAANSAHLTVLIELGETENLLRQRLTVRYALSPRQAELLMLLRRNASTREVADRLQARPAALKSLMRELRLKLDLPDQRSLREFARALSAYSMSAHIE
jgi:transposase/DNA-binding CsgD family transcriptional regulator